MKTMPVIFAASVFITLTTLAQAQTWEAIDDPSQLAALFSDTVIEATLKDGVRAVARYNRDGTGVLEAWGDTFQRHWEVRGKDQVCINMGNQTICYRLERNTDVSGQYRIHNLATGETAIATIKTAEGEVIHVESSTVSSGGAAKPSADEIAKKLANPNTPLASLTFRYQYRTYTGDLPKADGQSSSTLLFQPSFPFPLENGDLILFRPAIPIQFDHPVFNAGKPGFDSEAGIGDISFDLAYARTTKSGILLAVGVISTLPTATEDSLGPDRWTLGPEFLIGKITKDYALGAFPSHQWDVGGSGDADISITSAQLFATFLPGGGWNVGTSPILSYDHEIEEWTIPLNLTIGKTMVLNGRPWKFSFEINYFVEQPDAFGPEWLFGFNVAPVVQNSLVNLFK